MRGGARLSEASVQHLGPGQNAPTFIRAGAIIPMRVDDGETGHGGPGSSGHLTLLLYPHGDSVRMYHPDAQGSLLLRSRRDFGSVSVEIDPQTERYVLRTKEQAQPESVALDRGEFGITLEQLPSWEAFNGATEGWYYDAAGRYLWARFATEETGVRLTYTTAVTHAPSEANSPATPPSDSMRRAADKRRAVGQSRVDRGGPLPCDEASAEGRGLERQQRRQLASDLRRLQQQRFFHSLLTSDSHSVVGGRSSVVAAAISTREALPPSASLARLGGSAVTQALVMGAAICRSLDRSG
jgi:hypothetical protein